jgi:hypothetical protein
MFNTGNINTKSLLESFNLLINLSLAEIIKEHFYKIDGLNFNIMSGKIIDYNAIINKEEKIKSVVFMKNLVKAMVMKLTGTDSIDLSNLKDFNFHSQVRYKHKYLSENLENAQNLKPGQILYKI